MKLLASVLGRVASASAVMPAGSLFARELRDLYNRAVRANKRCTVLNAESLLDIRWWLDAASIHNGRCYLPHNHRRARTHFQLATDASGAYGAFWDPSSGRWAVFEFPKAVGETIANKELYAILVGIAACSDNWHAKRVRIWSDNTLACRALTGRALREVAAFNAILRLIFTTSVRANFLIHSMWVSTAFNQIADALSRLKWQLFRSLAPEANTKPVDLSKLNLPPHLRPVAVSVPTERLM